ncbi:hypothetical protein U9M48_037218, partial [Paspalum notatum var. saurae]
MPARPSPIDRPCGEDGRRERRPLVRMGAGRGGDGDASAVAGSAWRRCSATAAPSTSAAAPAAGLTMPARRSAGVGDRAAATRAGSSDSCATARQSGAVARQSGAVARRRRGRGGVGGATARRGEAALREVTGARQRPSSLRPTASGVRPPPSPSDLNRFKAAPAAASVRLPPPWIWLISGEACSRTAHAVSHSPRRNKTMFT